MSKATRCRPAHRKHRLPFSVEPKRGLNPPQANSFSPTRGNRGFRNFANSDDRRSRPDPLSRTFGASDPGQRLIFSRSAIFGFLRMSRGKPPLQELSWLRKGTSVMNVRTNRPPLIRQSFSASRSAQDCRFYFSRCRSMPRRRGRDAVNALQASFTGPIARGLESRLRSSLARI